MGNGKRPTPEFRREAVRLALTSGRTRRETAEELGIGLSTLPRWLRAETLFAKAGQVQCGSERFNLKAPAVLIRPAK